MTPAAPTFMPARRRTRAALTSAALIAALAGAGAVAPAAVAKTTLSGPTTFTFTGDAFSKQGIKVKARGSVVEATTGGVTRYVAPTTTGVFGSKTTRIAHSGSLRFSRKAGGTTRTITVSALDVQLKSKGSVVRAKVGGKKINFLTLDLRKGDFSVDRATSTVRLPGARGTLTKTAATRIGSALRIKSVRRSGFVVVATTSSPAGSDGVGGGTDTGGAGSGGGGAGGGAGTGSKSYPAPTPLTRPASAVDVAASAFKWRVRDSLICYLWTGNGASASGDAWGDAARYVSDCGGTYVTDFNFKSAGGWYDAASGKARLAFTGAFLARYAGHGLAFDIVDPVVELDPTSDRSRVIARFDGATSSSVKATGVLVDLDPKGANKAGTGGANFVFGKTPGGLASGAAFDAFSGFYEVGSDQGTFDISFSTAP